MSESTNSRHDPCNDGDPVNGRTSKPTSSGDEASRDEATGNSSSSSGDSPGSGSPCYVPTSVEISPVLEKCRRATCKIQANEEEDGDIDNGSATFVALPSEMGGGNAILTNKHVVNTADEVTILFDFDAEDSDVIEHTMALTNFEWDASKAGGVFFSSAMVDAAIVRMPASFEQVVRDAGIDPIPLKSHRAPVVGQTLIGFHHAAGNPKQTVVEKVLSSREGGFVSYSGDSGGPGSSGSGVFDDDGNLAVLHRGRSLEMHASGITMATIMEHFFALKAIAMERRYAADDDRDVLMSDDEIELVPLTEAQTRQLITGERFCGEIFSNVTEAMLEMDSDADALTPIYRCKGTLTDTNGDVLSGNFIDGSLNGLGMKTEADGNLQQGMFEENILTGRGRRVDNDGDVHEGDFEDGELHGQGKLSYNDGMTIEGTFVAGELHGKGRRVDDDGDVYEGDGFIDGILHGTGRRTTLAGEIFEGTFKDGELHGKGKWTDADGMLHEGTFSYGELDGPGRTIDTDGEIVEGTFVAGELQGKGKRTCADGEVHHGSFKNGALQGRGSLQKRKRGAMYTALFKDDVVVNEPRKKKRRKISRSGSVA